MIIMEAEPKRMELRQKTHDDYYARKPRGVGVPVEKSWKNSPCDAKYGKSGGFLGEGRPGPKRGASINKDLRATHPPLFSGSFRALTQDFE
jgi:hypothetical protein